MNDGNQPQKYFARAAVPCLGSRYTVAPAQLKRLRVWRDVEWIVYVFEWWHLAFSLRVRHRHCGLSIFPINPCPRNFKRWRDRNGRRTTGNRGQHEATR